MKNTIYATLFFAFAWLSLLSAETLSIRASVDRTTLAVNEQLVLTIELQGEGANSGLQPALPDLSGFLNFLGSGGTSQSIQIINGRMSVQRSITNYYMAVKEGTFTIPPITVTYNGRSYESQPISLTISKGATAPAQSQRPSAPAPQAGQTSRPTEGDEQLFIRAIVNKRQVYVNEPVIVTYRIFTLVQVAGMGQAKMAPSPGFWVEDFDIGQTLQQREEIYNGRKYVVADIKKSAYFPTSAGAKTIQSMVIPFDVRAASRRRSNDIFDSFFDDPFFSRVVRKEISTRPVDIDVLPLPEEGKPADFNGLVGQFNLVADIDKQTAKTNEAITLKVRYSGQGNVRTMPKPNLLIPNDFERYEPKVTENVSRQGDAISGSKTYEYVLIPRFPGQQRIAPVTLSFFDPQARKYRTVSSQEFLLTIQKGEGTIAVAPSGLNKEEVRLIGQDVRFIKTTTPMFRRSGQAFHSSSTFLILVVLPLLALAGAFGYKRHLQKLSGDVAYARRRSANRMAMKRLAKAGKVLGEATQKEFYSEISRALIGFAADRLNLPEAGIITAELEKRLQERGIEAGLIGGYLQLLQVCDFQRFAPATVKKEEMEKFFMQAKEAIIKLEKAF